MLKSKGKFVKAKGNFRFRGKLVKCAYYNTALPRTPTLLDIRSEDSGHRHYTSDTRAPALQFTPASWQWRDWHHDTRGWSPAPHQLRPSLASWRNWTKNERNYPQKNFHALHSQPVPVSCVLRLAQAMDGRKSGKCNQSFEFNSTL